MNLQTPNKEANQAGDGFRPEFFEELFNLEANNFWFQNRSKLVVWAIDKFFPRSQTFLEIGCGTGYMLMQISKALPRLQLFGSEYFEEGLEYARKRLPNIPLLTMDARDLPHSDNVDVIGAFDVIEHIDEDELVLQQLHKTCRQGIVITVPQHKFLWSQIDEYSCHRRRYSAQELTEKLERAGFVVAFQTSFISLLLPLLLVSRLAPKSKKTFDPMQELRLHPLLNAVLSVVEGLERSLIKAGVKFCAGGSLLVVARKVNPHA